MKKSKFIFGLIAVLVATVCIIVMLQSSSQNPTATESGKTDTATTGYELDDYSDITIPPAPTMPTIPIELDDYVTISKVEKNPNEVIDRTGTISEDDPEYLDGIGALYSGPEGKVCRNDKTISISIFNDAWGDLYDFTFGYVTGECNRFIYLNPVAYRNGVRTQMYYHFANPSSGKIVTPNPDKTLAPQKSYRYYHAMDECEFAEFTNFQQPGVVWYPDTETDEPVYIDLLAVDSNGDAILAALRITIIKDENDGTYSIVDLDNLNLIQQPNPLHPEFDTDELLYLVDMAKEIIMNPANHHFGSASSKPELITIERCLIEFTDHLHYRQFIPDHGVEDLSCKYEEMLIPFIAVTYNWYGYHPYTLYFQVMRFPKEDEHGKYTYIGLDYPNFIYAERLRNKYDWNGTD